MKIALAQINTTVADVRGNAALIRRFARRAQDQGADLCVFPEQSLGGYPALDLWEDPDFIDANQKALLELARASGAMGLLVGFVARNPSRTGKPVMNAAALLHKGKVQAIRAKTLLPTYDVFDEARYFEPAKANAPILFKGVKLGVSICEDAWSAANTLYPTDPVGAQIRAGAQILVNLSASPFIRGKQALRERLMSAHARKAKKPLLYCNQVGANDELVFDGGSLAIGPAGRVAARAALFQEELLIVDTARMPEKAAAPARGDIEQVAGALALGIRDYVRKCGFERVHLGLSGGIDSAVVCALAVLALGPDAVTGVAMPSPYSSDHSLRDAKALAENLGVRFLTIPIEPVYRAFLDATAPSFGPAADGEVALWQQNLQARIRGNLLMALSNKEGGLLLSTGNKSELSVGYCTLYGDMSGGLSVLADVPKRTVYELARWLNRERELIPASSIAKAPSAELKPNQKDQDDLPAYDVLDRVLESYVEGRKSAAAIARQGVPRDLVLSLLARIDRAEYKRRQAAPSIKISPKAYGVGRRMPLARGSYR